MDSNLTFQERLKTQLNKAYAKTNLYVELDVYSSACND